jgi:prepilin-type N-terminal cleavage/methylation domain-containing protein/prepilin-type processing-associated H-X9-DG protein
MHQRKRGFTLIELVAVIAVIGIAETATASYAVLCRADSRLALQFLLPASRNPERYFVSCSNSRHPGGVHLLMADGAVRFVSETID